MNDTNIVIRVFTPSDLAQITAVEKSVYGSAAYSAFFFRQLYDLFPTLIWVAEGDSALVGHVCGAVEQGGETGWILNVAVLAHYRRQGIGHRLLKRCVDQLMSGGVKRVKITAEPEDAAAIGLYKKLGFTEVRVIEDYYGPELDRLILEYC